MAKRFTKLKSVMERLRGEEGCPWDREQTRESLKPFLLEETYEVLEAIDEKDPDLLKEELGDLLFQIMFHAQIAKERDEFEIDDVLVHLIGKMTRRHPHVFGPKRGSARGGKTDTTGDVLARWEQIKRKEKRNLSRQSVMDGVPISLPALMRAFQLQTRASRVGFDWKEMKPVLGKVREEMKELEQAIEAKRPAEIRDEMGDLFFSLVNLARFLKLDPEESLRGTNRRFVDRFHYIEQKAGQSGKQLSEMSLKEMNQLWSEAKKVEKRRSARRSR